MSDRAAEDAVRDFQRAADELRRHAPGVVVTLATNEHHEDGKRARASKAAERERGARTAAQRRAQREARDQAIAEYALKLAASSEELSENPKAVPGAVLAHWRREWGEPLALSTVRRILSAQRVASRVRCSPTSAT